MNREYLASANMTAVGSNVGFSGNPKALQELSKTLGEGGGGSATSNMPSGMRDMMNAMIAQARAKKSGT